MNRVVLTARLPLLFLFVLLALPLVYGSMITDFRVTAGGAPMTAISPSHQQLVDLSFTVDEREGFVMLDLSQLHSDMRVAANYRSTRIQLTACTYNVTSNTSRCTLPNMLIMPTNATVAIPYYFWRGGSQYPGQLTHTFVLDNTSPSVSSIQTAVCNQAKTQCFVGSGLPTNVTVTLQDSDGTFNKHLIFFQLGPTVFNAANCTTNACVGRATVTCADEVPLDLKVVNANGVPSQDDAGNPVLNPGEVQRVICDAASPVVVNVTAEGTEMLHLITQNGQLLIKASVRDAVTLVTMTANTGNVQFNVSANTTMSAPCTRTVNDAQECALSIGNLKFGRNLAVPIVFSDQVGHATTRTLIIPSILKVANASTTPNFFSAKANKVTPEVVNRVALQLAFDNALDYPLFINYKIGQLSSGAKILQQKIPFSTCQVAAPKRTYTDYFAPHPDENWTNTPALFIGDAEGNLRLYFPKADWDVENRIDASFLSMDTQQLSKDLLLVRCNLTLVVAKDNVLYTVPEQETIYWPVKLRDSKLGTPGKAFLDKMHREEEGINGGLNRVIGYANTITSTFAHLCQLQGIVNMLQMQGLSVQSIGMLMMQTGAGQSIAQGGNSLWGKMWTVTATTWMGKVAGSTQGDASGQAYLEKQGTFRKYCNYIHCDIANKTEQDKDKWYMGGDFASGLENSSLGKSKAAGQYFQDLNTPDVSNSLIMSVATRCVSGVVYNLNKYRQIDCGYLQCLKEQALNGASIAPCDEAKGVKMCRFITGEIFELPYVRVLKNLAANVNQIVQNPLSLLVNKVSASVCVGKDQEISPQGLGCQLMKSLSAQKDFQSVTANNGLFSYPYQADLCQKALCEGKGCDRTTGSLIEQLSPTYGYTGDQYRQQWLKDREAKTKTQTNANLIKDLRGWNGQEGTMTDNMKNYALTHGTKKENTFTFYDKTVNNCGKGATRSECVDNFEYQFKNNKEPTESNYNAYVPKDQQKSFSAFNALYGNLKSSNPDYTCTGSTCTPTRCGSQKGVTDTERCNKLWDQSSEYNKQLEGYKICSEGSGEKTERKLCKGECGGSDCYTNQQTSAAGLASADDLKRKRAQEFYSWVDQMFGVAYQYMRESGQLDSLFLSGWGDWGAQTSAGARELLDPEEWKNNLCNPAGQFNDYLEDDGSLYTWQGDAYRAVLTFAGERLPYEQRAASPDAPIQNLYTLSAVVVSPKTNNEMSIVLNPGNRVVEDNIALAKGQVVNKAKAFNDTVSYTEVCLVFEKEFPQAGGDTEYCRKLQPSAYDRGTVTNETMPDWGIDDPWSTTWSATNTQNGAQNGQNLYGTGTTGTTGTAGG